MEEIIKLGIASGIGTLIGFERGYKNGNVGVGTCSLITMASTLLTVISTDITNGEPTRLISTIVSSVGFLCGGVIFVRGKSEDDSEEVVGLTTGVILYCLSALGIVIGLGDYKLVIATTVLMMINIGIAKIFKRYIFNNITGERK